MGLKVLQLIWNVYKSYRNKKKYQTHAVVEVPGLADESQPSIFSQVGVIVNSSSGQAKFDGIRSSNVHTENVERGQLNSSPQLENSIDSGDFVDENRNEMSISGDFPTPLKRRRASGPESDKISIFRKQICPIKTVYLQNNDEK